MADNLQEQLYQNIRAALLEGRFQPGERLKIRDLAAEWGTSPMPVRGALQRLVAEGARQRPRDGVAPVRSWGGVLDEPLGQVVGGLRQDVLRHRVVGAVGAVARRDAGQNVAQVLDRDRAAQPGAALAHAHRMTGQDA